MFQNGYPVRCINAKMEGMGPCLTEGRIYHVEEFVPPEQCKNLFPNDTVYGWEKEGGRVKLKEEPGYFFGRRFEEIRPQLIDG